MSKKMLKGDYGHGIDISLYWFKLRHPVDGKEWRISLQTGSRSLAARGVGGIEVVKPSGEMAVIIE